MPKEKDTCPHCGRSNETLENLLVIVAYLMIMKQENKIEIHGLLMEGLPLDRIHVERTFDDEVDMYTYHFALAAENDVPA